MGLFDAFRKFKGQGDYQGEQPVRLSSTPWGQESWKNLQQGFARKGTGYTPELIDSSKATWANSARDYLQNTVNPGITARQSAGGLGRSSLVGAQMNRAGVESELGLADRIAALQQSGQDQEIGTQRSAMGIMPGVAQADVQSQLQRANFQKQNFDQQLQYRQAAEQNRNQSIDSLIGLAAPMAGGALESVAPYLAGIPGIGPFLAGGAKMLGGGLTSAGDVMNKNAASVEKLGGEDKTRLAEILEQLMGGGGTTGTGTTRVSGGSFSNMTPGNMGFGGR